MTVYDERVSRCRRRPELEDSNEAAKRGLRSSMIDPWRPLTEAICPR
jgi:hypothetical protein